MKLLLLALCLGAMPLIAEDLQTEVARIESAVLEPARAIAVKDVVLNAGRATITLRQGALIPTSVTRDGSAAEVVFIGEGRIVLDPPDAIEASQLELFTGKTNLDEDFGSAVLVTADDALVAALHAGQPVQVTSDVLAQAAARYGTWTTGPYRGNLGVGANLLADRLGEPQAQSFFAALFSNPDVGEFVYSIDGDADEEITLGQFVPEELTEREKRRVGRQLAREQRRGRGIGARVDDLGTWNTWISEPRDPHAVHAAAFQPEHYALDVTIEPGTLLLRARSRISLLAATGGRRILSLTLHPDLQVQRVTDARGAPLFHQRWRDELLVVFPTAPAAGTRLDLEVVYSGVAVAKGDRKTYAVRDPERWYPQLGTVDDRATYEATFRWPKKLQLLAAGHETGGGTSPDGNPWATYALETATSELGFELGVFEIEEFKAGHVQVTLAFDASSARLEDDIRREIRSTIETALQYLEQKLGPYPGDHLTVVTVPRGYSQSLFTFITLSTDMMRDYRSLAALFRFADRRAVIAHELSHQWWGHVVGWRTYRARWISEAMAQYMALRFAREKLQFDDRMKVLPTAGWRRGLAAATPDGRTVESVGPLVLGERLSSTRAPSAYESIVYDKGALVMMMLGRVVGEQRFDAALRTLLERAAGKRISTEEFVIMLGEATGLEIAPFARQWVYGTGLPAISYSYEFVQEEPGQWKVKGIARQKSDTLFRYRVVRDERGALSVRRERVPAPDAGEVPIFVPLRVEVVNPEDKSTYAKLKAGEGNGYAYASIVVRGRETPFVINVQWEPKRLQLDPGREVLALFYNEQRNPRRVLFERAEELSADGQWSEAERQYRAGLAAPPTNDVELEMGVNLEGAVKDIVSDAERAFLEAQLHLGLARALLEQGNDAAAVASVADARKTLGRSRRRLFESDANILEARLDLRRGDAERAFRRLRNVIDDRDSVASAEAWLLLAVAAKQSNHPHELEKARERARKAGIDVSLLH